jgi:hypothetical protein
MVICHEESLQTISNMVTRLGLLIDMPLNA